MPLRNARPLVFRGRTASDAVDATNVAPGAMQLLTNLTADHTTADCWVCRPAAIEKTTFTGFATPGFVSCELVVGDIAYGMIASARFAGKDDPFAYNIATNTFLTISGVASANCPTSPPATGDWTPPIICQVGSRIIICHPGFPGGATKFGWLDISGGSFTLASCTTINGQATVTTPSSLLGIQPGMTVTGTGVAAATTVVSTMPSPLVRSCNTFVNFNQIQIPSGNSVALVGITVTGPGIPDSTTVSAIVADGITITLSNAATATATGVDLQFAGTAEFVLSQNATASGTVTLTVAGGTTTTPLWGAGDADINPLPSIPLGVAQFNGRAYFVLGTNGIVFSDSGFPCRVSNSVAVQALTTNDGLACTAIAPLLLSSPITGGIVQALIIFEGSNKMQQIEGDLETGNLSLNVMPVATGTNSPLSISPCNLGLSFASPEGMRIIDFGGNVSDPIGDQGTGIVAPFKAALNPSRICSAASVDTLRISLNNAGAMQEWWWEFGLRRWSGPHTFPASLIQPWRNTFLMAPAGITASLWQSDVEPGASSVFVENGAQMTFAWKTSLLPDNQAMAMNEMVQTALASAMPGNGAITVTATDENGNVLDSAAVSPPASSQQWGSGIWGQMVWGAGEMFQQRRVNWSKPLVFKQMQIAVTGNCDPAIKIGNLYMKYQILGYLLEVG